MRYPAPSDVIRFNETTEGAGELLDPGRLEAALQRPLASAFGEDVYPDIHSKAAAMFQSLAHDHAFVNGNKRTAFHTVGFFYAINGWWLYAEDRDVIDLAVDAATGTIDVPEIARWLKERAEPVEAL